MSAIARKAWLQQEVYALVRSGLARTPAQVYDWLTTRYQVSRPAVRVTLLRLERRGVLRRARRAWYEAVAR